MTSSFSGLALVGMGAGTLMILVGSIWFLIKAFKTSIAWGLGCLLFPPTQLVYLVLHFEESAPPFILSLAGTVVSVLIMGTLPRMLPMLIQ